MVSQGDRRARTGIGTLRRKWMLLLRTVLKTDMVTLRRKWMLLLRSELRRGIERVGTGKAGAEDRSLFSFICD